MGKIEISEHRFLCIIAVASVFLFFYEYFDARVDWSQEFTETVKELQVQGKMRMAELLSEAGPDSFRFRFYFLKHYWIRATFIAMIAHILIIKFGTYIPNQVLAYRFCVVTAKILPVVIVLAFLFALSRWVDVRYEAEALSLEIGDTDLTELRFHVAIRWAYGSLIHCIWIGWWTYVIATWMLPAPGLSRISRFLLPGSTISMFDKNGSVY